jgi:hypothetical protein
MDHGPPATGGGRTVGSLVADYGRGIVVSATHNQRRLAKQLCRKIDALNNLVDQCHAAGLAVNFGISYDMADSPAKTHATRPWVEIPTNWRTGTIGESL